jgi:hypothetical protein
VAHHVIPYLVVSNALFPNIHDIPLYIDLIGLFVDPLLFFKRLKLRLNFDSQVCVRDVLLEVDERSELFYFLFGVKVLQRVNE